MVTFTTCTCLYTLVPCGSMTKYSRRSPGACLPFKIVNEIYNATFRVFLLPGFGDLLVLVLVHDEVGGLTRRVNNQWVPVEPVEHDGVLRTQVVRRQRVGLPAQALISVGQVLLGRKNKTKVFIKCI